MDIVIRISESYYKELITTDDFYLDILGKTVKNGTPLPKGHGALVDRGEVIKSLFDYKKGKKTLGQCIEDVQTIIEADWEDEEE